MGTRGIGRDVEGCHRKKDAQMLEEIARGRKRRKLLTRREKTIKKMLIS